jgi:putative transcriptional regulator
MSKHLASLKGQLLLDGGKLQGSFFQRTVVLVCQHDESGAFGLVLNRETSNTVGEVLVADLPDTVKSSKLFLGGPVQPSTLSFLYKGTTDDTDEDMVLSGLKMGHSLDELVEADKKSGQSSMRIFAGYSGWSPGQLDDEIKRDSWLIQPADMDLIFQMDTGNLWRNILLGMGWQYRLLAQQPEDLSWN